MRMHKLCSHTSLAPAEGRSIAQAVSCWLPIAAARVRVQVRLCGICGGQSGTRRGFLRVIRIPPTAPHSSSTIRVWYNRQIGGRRTKWTQSHRTPRNQNTYLLNNQNYYHKVGTKGVNTENSPILN
jgi:hypothetical protein